MSRPLAKGRRRAPAGGPLARALAAAAKPVRLWVGRPHVRRADALRAQSDWIEAVIGYRRGLDWLPWREDLKIQIGNCLKEYGDYRGAVKAYSSVRGSQHRPEAMKQIADANRLAGTTILPYAMAENPGELIGDEDDTPLPAVTARLLPNRLKLESEQERHWLGALGRTDHRAVRSRGNVHPSVALDQVGALSMDRDGVQEPLLTGVIAIRARIVSPSPLETVEIHLGDGTTSQSIATVPVTPVERSGAKLRLYVVNAWIDAAKLPRGRHWLSVDAGRWVPSHGLFVNVVEMGDAGTDLASSNSFVPSPADGRDPEQVVVSAPAELRPAARSIFDRPIRSILAVRVDQLGDVSASLPAVARLRELFPEARVTMLVQPGVRAVVEASGLADEVVTVQLPYNVETERRHLPVEEEQRLRGHFDEAHFDLAIDLCPNDETRPLLLLSNATYLVGFNSDRFTFLDFGIGLRSRDKVNQLEKLSHAATVLTLVEALAVAVTPKRPPVVRVASGEAVLAGQGLKPRGYVVLHTGARHAINRWPGEHYLALAERIAAETAHDVAIFWDDPADPSRPATAGSERIRFLHGLDADAFDAIVANARLMVGNDSGPKHLAATRGVPTVSVHVDRLNWNEWGQDSEGVIVSKRMPCTGCGLNDLQLCGRDAVCVRSIGVDEVYEAARPYL
jgi:ADP-heptose:LPS heptosyltransferase